MSETLLHIAYGNGRSEQVAMGVHVNFPVFSMAGVVESLACSEWLILSCP